MCCCGCCFSFCWRVLLTIAWEIFTVETIKKNTIRYQNQSMKYTCFCLHIQKKKLIRILLYGFYALTFLKWTVLMIITVFVIYYDYDYDLFSFSLFCFSWIVMNSDSRPESPAKLIPCLKMRMVFILDWTTREIFSDLSVDFLCEREKKIILVSPTVFSHHRFSSLYFVL